MALIQPARRTSGLDRIALTVALGFVPLLVAVIRDSTDLALPLVIFALTAGSAMGWVADDPVGELVAPCPIASPMQISYRLALAAPFVCTGVALGLLVVALISELPTDWVDRIPELVAAAALALATGLTLRRRGEPLGGVSGVLSAIIAPLMIAALSARWPATFPTFQASPTHVRWWAIAAAAALVAAHASRDAASPGWVVSARSSLPKIGSSTHIGGG